MKSRSIILIVATIIFCSFQNTFAQQTSEKQDTTLTVDFTKINYTCPMHSEIISDKPGTCPKCGMELVKLEKGEKQSEPMQHQMGMMMCSMHGMVNMNHKHDEQKKDNMKMMQGKKGMVFLMVAMMVVMLIIKMI
ncbi:MAG: heavy metal-binding domain-containing protein [Bacteroidota bacterium]|nr:heavy metal-binding domain-containing protein [Bacteroidota bacterium]